MTTTQELSAGREGPVRRRPVRASVSALCYNLALAPMGLAALVAAVTGRSVRVYGWWRSLAAAATHLDPGEQRTHPSPARIGSHAVASIALGLVGLVEVGLIALMVMRGALFGLVTDGNYAQSWGGPSRAGAWIVHFLVSVPVAAAAVVLAHLIVWLHVRLTARLSGQRVERRVMPIALVVVAATALFVTAFLRQL